MRRIARRFAIVAAVLLRSGAVLATDQAERAPILEGLGDHHHPITTSSETAQKYFDQGLVLAWGFNHREAHRSFSHAGSLGSRLCFSV